MGAGAEGGGEELGFHEDSFSFIRRALEMAVMEGSTELCTARWQIPCCVYFTTIRQHFKEHLQVCLVHR